MDNSNEISELFDDFDLASLLDKPRLNIIRRRSFDEVDLPGLEPQNGSNGSFSSQVDSLFTSDSDPTPDLNGLLSSSMLLLGLLSSKNKIDSNLRSLRFEAAQELSDQPKKGVIYIYKEVTANIESIMERLEYLSKKEESFTIDEASEIADAAQILKLLRRPEMEIIDVAVAGQMTHDGALMILQAEKLSRNGRNLLDRGKSILQLAKLKPDTS